MLSLTAALSWLRSSCVATRKSPHRWWCRCFGWEKFLFISFTSLSFDSNSPPFISTLPSSLILLRCERSSESSPHTQKNVYKMHNVRERGTKSERESFPSFSTPGSCCSTLFLYLQYFMLRQDRDIFDVDTNRRGERDRERARERAQSARERA